MSKVDLDNFNIATAEKPQLKYFAMEKYGLGLSMSMSETTMREKIQEHCIQNDLPMPISELGTDNVKLKADMVYHIINIPKSEKAGGEEPVFVGWNGKGFTIPRGVDVKVPKPVVEILKNAKQDLITQDEDGIIHHNDVPTYPFSDLGPVQ